MPNDDIKFETPALLRDYVQMTLNMQYWQLIMAPESYMYLFTWVSVSVFGLLNALLREITNVKSEQFVPHKEWGQILNKSLGHLHLCILK